MGLADASIKMGYKYGSSEFLEFCKNIAESMAFYSLYSSIEIAKLKGSFPIWDKTEYENDESPKDLVLRNIDIVHDECQINEIPSFMNALLLAKTRNFRQKITTYDNLVDNLKKYGLRNSRRLSIAPTGSISLILNTSSSIEPNFAYEWTRKITVSSTEKKDLIYKHKLNTEKNNKRGLLVSAFDLTAKQHIDVVKEFSNYIDSGISKCVAEGTKIQTNKGIINIEDFSNNRKDNTFVDITDKDIYVKDMNGDWKKVLSHYCGGKNKTIKIKLDNGFILECSENHKLMTETGWKKSI